MADHTVAVTVNGELRRQGVEARLTLADFLREHCQLRSVHLGCEHGVCGACTVLVDQVAVRSCLMFAVQADNATVTTVEGLTPNAGLGPIQQAFHEEHALQCGFCTPGFVVSVHGLLSANPHPSREQILDVLSGNLCRCTGYQGLCRAVARLAGEDTGQASHG